MPVKFIPIQARGGVYTGGKGLLTGWMVFCLQVDGPITLELEGGGGTYNRKFTVLRKNNVKKSHDQKLA